MPFSWHGGDVGVIGEVVSLIINEWREASRRSWAELPSPKVCIASFALKVSSGTPTCAHRRDVSSRASSLPDSLTPWFIEDLSSPADHHHHLWGTSPSAKCRAAVRNPRLFSLLLRQVTVGPNLAYARLGPTLLLITLARASSTSRVAYINIYICIYVYTDRSCDPSYIYIYIHIYTCTPGRGVYTYTYIYIYTYIQIGICTSHVYIYIYIYMYIHMYSTTTHTYIYIYIYTYTYGTYDTSHMYTYTYTYIYIYTYTSRHAWTQMQVMIYTYIYIIY